MKPHLLMLHGALGSAAQLKPIADRLAGQYDIHLMDFQGHGGTSTDCIYSMDLFTEQVAEKIEKLKLKKMAVFGYSMGGYIALNTAHNHPELIGEIVTLGTKFDWSPDSAKKEIKLLNPEIIAEKVPKFAEKLKETHAPSDWKIVMNRTAEMMVRMGDGERLHPDDFQKISHRTTLGIGLADEMVSVEETEKINGYLKNSRCIKLRAVQHPIDRVDLDVLEGYILTALASGHSE